MKLVQKSAGGLLGFYQRNASRLALAALALCTMLTSAMAQGYSYVSYDDVAGTVSFTPGVLVGALVGVVVAVLAAGGALWVLIHGVKWLGRALSVSGR